MEINNLIKILKEKLTKGIKINSIEIEDKSFLHKKHQNFSKDKFHIKLIIESSELKKISSIEANRKIKPSYEFMPVNDINSKFARTNSANINAWYSLPRSTIKINLYSQIILQTNNGKIEILGCDLNLNYNIFGNWILSGYLRHLSNPNILSDGIGDLLEFTLSGNENLFNNNMILFFNLGFTGWLIVNLTLVLTHFIVHQFLF